MTKKKRGRGRPVDTGIDDTRVLVQVADLLVAEPDLKKTPAIQRVVVATFRDTEFGSAERRLLRKWAKNSEMYLAAAKKRRAGRSVRRSIPTCSSDMSAVAFLKREMARIDLFADLIRDMSSFELVAEEVLRPMKELHDLIDQPHLRQIDEALALLPEIPSQTWPRALQDQLDLVDSITDL